MRTYLSLFLCLCVAASVGLVGCAKKEAPPPPPPAEQPAPADNEAMAPSMPEKAMEAGKEAMEEGKEAVVEAGKETMEEGKKAVEGMK